MSALQGAETLKTLTDSVRKRIIYQSEALFAGSSAAPKYLQRVQSANYSFTVPRVDVNQYGQLGQLERIITEVPTVSLDYSYAIAGNLNEKVIFGDDSAAGTKGIMNGINTTPATEKQLYQIALTDEGNDYIGNGASGVAVKIPNGFMTSASWTGSVGDVPTATMNVESTEMIMGTAEGSPAATDESGTTTPKVCRPGNISFNLNGSSDSTPTGSGKLPVLGFDVLHVQSFTCSLDMPRESIQRLGDKFEYARLITFPLTGTLSLEAIVSQQAADNLNEIVGTNDAASTDPGYDIDVSLGKEGAGGTNGLQIIMKDAKIESHSISSSIGANKSVTIDYSVVIDGGGTAEASANSGMFLKPIT
jgi:hypothetical protein